MALSVLVLDARLRQTLATVRSLGRRGLSVGALDTARTAPAFSSRGCQQRFICPASEGTDAYLTYLEQVLESPGARVLIPSADGTVALLRQHRARVERRARVALASESALSIAISKQQTLAVAEQLGVSVPRQVLVRTVAEVPSALKEIGLPAVVKPSESWLQGYHQGIRVVSQLVTNPDEARRGVAEFTRWVGGT